jgi:hypothetical protein
MCKSWRYRHPKFLRWMGNYCNSIWNRIILSLVTGTWVTRDAGFVAVAAQQFYLLHRRYERTGLFGPNTKVRYREKVYYSLYSREEWLTLAKVWYCTPVGTCAALAIPPAPRRTKATMHNACTYALVLNYPIILACTNVQNANIQGAFSDFFRNIQLR